MPHLVYNAHPKQAIFHHACRIHTDVLFLGGRGSGKTTAGAIQAILEATHNQPGSRGIVAAPTYSMLEDATMYEFFKWLPPQHVAHFSKARRILTLKNGSEVAFRSCDNPDSLRGPNRDWAWLDEPRNLPTREAFDIISAQLRPYRLFWQTTTPSGILHWLYSVFVANPLPSAYVVTVRTADNVYLPGQYEALLRTQYSEKFAAQELDASWISFEGVIYDDFHPSYNVTYEAEYDPERPVYWGVDDGYACGDGPGSSSYHPRVVLFTQFDARGGATVFDEMYVCGESDYDAWIQAALARSYAPPAMAYVDSSASVLRARISHAGIFNVGATHRVEEGIKNVRRLVKDANDVRLLRVHPRCESLVYEMQAYRTIDGTRSSGGQVAPLKVDDHGPDALRYVCEHLRQRGM